MHNIYKYLAIAMLVCLTVWYLPILAAKPRMVCPSDGKKPYFGVCPGGEDPVPAAEATGDRRDDSRPPVRTTTSVSERPQTKIGDCNASRRLGGGTVDCPPKEVVTPAADEGGVLFEFNKAVLTRKSRDNLDYLSDRMRSFTSIDRVLVTGHADRLGSDSYNMRLSRRRAETVRDYLVYKKAADEGQFEIDARGESDPVKDCPNLMPKKTLVVCLAPNRRAVIDVIGH